MVSKKNNAIELKLLTSNATRSLLDTLVAEFERVSGHKVAVTHDSAKVMLSRIKAGETADVAVLLSPAIEALVHLGTITASSSRIFSRSHIGIGIRAGSSKPDISTVCAFKRTLLEAKSIAHTVNGASGMCFPALAERLGLTELIRHKVVTRPGGLIGPVVVAGVAEIAFQQISELLAVPGIDVVGPIPAELQTIIESSAGIFADSIHSTAARSLLEFFASSTSAEKFRVKGLEPALS